MIQKWKSPHLEKVSNVAKYLLRKNYNPVLGFIDIGGKVKHIDLVKERFPEHKSMDIIYRPNYTYSLYQSPCLEIYYKYKSKEQNK